MNNAVKSGFSLFLIAILVFSNIAFPFFQVSFPKDYITTNTDSLYQDISLGSADELIYFSEKDLGKSINLKIEGQQSSFFINQLFSINLVHNAQVANIIANSKKVVINLSVSKIIFPFAYFW